eukprot:COSAG06_NODE_1238_length_10133_cov_3382.190452_17_plen_116_part_01
MERCLGPRHGACVRFQSVVVATGCAPADVCDDLARGALPPAKRNAPDETGRGAWRTGARCPVVLAPPERGPSRAAGGSHDRAGPYCTFARRKIAEAEASAGPEVAEQTLQNFEAGQ